MFFLGKPSKRKFAQQLRRAIADSGAGGDYAYDAGNFCLVNQDGDGHINLVNLYREYCSLPRKERPEHLAKLASVFGGAAASELPEDFAEARAHLRPKIWSRWAFAHLELQRQIQGGEQLDIPLYPLGSHLYSSLVYDTENAMRTISGEELEAWGVSYYEALEIACQNLDEATVAFAKIGDNFCSSVSGDDYDSSRVLLLDRIRSFGVAGTPIAITPHRGSMYFAGGDDETALKMMFDMTAETAEEVRPLCPLPLVLEDDEWVDWIPPKNHVLRERFDDLELQYLGGLYAEQKEMLEAVFEGEDDAPFVATFTAGQKEGTEKLRSYCVWGEGVDSLLPRTQFVVLTTEEGIVAAGEWGHVASVAGTLMVPDESYYPTRYRVREFPSPQQLAEIGMQEL